MAQSSNRTGPWLAFLVGGLIVAVAMISYFAYASRQAAPDLSQTVGVNLTLPKPPPMPDAPRLPAAPIPVPK
ncbi:MAG: hypothetical protein Q8N10_01445 [Phenylobacterium sp.]|uniref:hypothetical protein n=1 Tax=Phenylobacterium sp. TaxID=1871053 RepID=UPI0027285D07|nr:hypothetical protein [Phenylobacterium sp.]MDO8912774.1 hypothetical protein [Phenylobacterium sp.]MDP3099145.1 hypothetical protein [Phenylobacterium sp.]HQT53156.1 hypothetical protein [Phenylobacterium sp.]